MEEKDAGGSGVTGAASSQQQTVSPAMMGRLKDYVSAIAARMFFELPEADDAMVEALNSPDAVEAISRFVGDARVPVLYFETCIPTGKSKIHSSSSSSFDHSINIHHLM